MPELPEVEYVCRELKNSLKTQQKLVSVQTSGFNLRYPIAKNILATSSQKIINIDRRAKYLIFEFEKCYWISHLGMSGYWEISSPPPEKRKHDHIILKWSTQDYWIYNDTRRFGFVLFKKTQKDILNYFSKLGPEPLSQNFNVNYFKSKLKINNVNIKNFIMDQHIVVGVGNIYACEVLFLAKVKPTRLAKSLTNSEIKLIVNGIKKILKSAILYGGSSISDFRHLNGESGKFQSLHKVYGKDSQPCPCCKTLIKNVKISGRSSFYCPNCQK